MKIKIFRILFAVMALSLPSLAQTYALMPIPRQCFNSPSGVPLSGGMLFSYAAGTSTPQATYADYTGTIQNTNPVVLDSAGCAQIWISPNVYKFELQDSLGSSLWVTDNVSDLGLLAAAKSVLLLPPGRALQTIVGPLAADYFQGVSNHITSPNVRVSLIDPNSVFDTPVNPPTFVVDSPTGTRTYRIFDPLHNANFVMNPNGTGNVLDCSQDGITCKRTAYVYFEGGGCNNTTSAMGWDTFGTFSPVPKCVTGTNIQKGVLAFPSAATFIQDNTGTLAAGTSLTTTYPAATVTGNLLVAVIGVDTGRTISGCTDGTNAYTLAKRSTNSTLGLEVWYFNGNATGMAAASTLTCTLSGSGNAALHWMEYNGILTASALDVTASNSGTGTAVTSGTTAGTAQNTELIISAVSALVSPAITGQDGWVKHQSIAETTHVIASDQGKIQQATATQSGTFTLASSQAWASAVVAFKANVTGSTRAQRHWFTPAFFSTASRPVDTGWYWLAPEVATGTINVQLAAQVVCSAPGSSDDPVFLAGTAATASVSATAPLISTYTPLTPLVSTGCAANNLLHFQVFRQQYDPNDTYEGYVYLIGAPLFYGVNN